METKDWFTKPCVMGIDEAGRGPVLGPMVYACACCPLSTSLQLVSRSFADSKTLTEAKREQLFEEIQADEQMASATDSLSAATISAQMLRRHKISLNALASDSTHRLIDAALAAKMNLHEIYIDTVGDAERYETRLGHRYPTIKFTVRPKADALFPIVSAASIVAKVTRDHLLRDFEVQESVDVSRQFGSGYPADPDTKTWLDQHIDPVFGYPGIVRFSWQTCESLLNQRGVPITWECPEDEGQQTLQQWGRSSSSSSQLASSSYQAAPKRHSFFRARKLARPICSF
ncbi:hypothetical protein WJX74_004776 [Apatococcus lobatus]|uniref:Ribonuclease n=1 Tax=Apatococcus lobatus TaxID=904363 RepID=A0AAW1QKA3_9CHLO